MTPMSLKLFACDAIIVGEGIPVMKTGRGPQVAIRGGVGRPVVWVDQTLPLVEPTDRGGDHRLHVGVTLSHFWGVLEVVAPPQGREQDGSVLLFVEIQGEEDSVSGTEPIVHFHDSGRGGETTYVLVVLRDTEHVEFLVAGGGRVVATNNGGCLDLQRS